MRARQAALRTRWVYIGLDLYPYQVAVGLSVRWLGGAHLRLYAGPVKLYLGTSTDPLEREVSHAG